MTHMLSYKMVAHTVLIPCMGFDGICNNACTLTMEKVHYSRKGPLILIFLSILNLHNGFLIKDNGKYHIGLDRMYCIYTQQSKKLMSTLENKAFTDN